MDKISKQIEYVRDNSLLLHQIFTDLEDDIVRKFIETSKESREIPGLKFIWNTCSHSHYAVVAEACQTIVNLTIQNVLEVEESVSSLISYIPTSNHQGLLIDTIMKILPNYPLLPSTKGTAVAKHPCILIFNMQPDMWPYILQHIQFNMIHDSNVDHTLKYLKQFMLHVLCFGENYVQLSLWNLLMGKLSSTKNPKLLDMLLEYLVWQQNEDLLAANFHLMCIQQLCEYALTSKDEELGQIMALFQVSVIEFNLKKYEFNIHSCVEMLKRLDNEFTLCLDPLIVIISQFLLNSYGICYGSILSLCLQLLGKNINCHIWGMLQFAILPAFTYSSTMEAYVTQILEVLPNQIRISGPIISSNLYYRHIIRGNGIIQIALAARDITEVMEDSTEKSSFLKKLPHLPLCDIGFLLSCSLFWCDSELSALDYAVRYTTVTKKSTNHLLILLFKKLTSSCDPRVKLCILYALPKLAFDKTCISRILHMFEALSGHQNLQPLRLRLLTELWMVEDRTYPYLEKAICSTQHQSDEFLIAKASAIHSVCLLRPEKYGANFLSQISELLNVSLCTHDLNSNTIATLALNSLIELCKAEVVDLKPVWDILAPKLNQDHRTPIVNGMCHLLALAATSRVDTLEYTSFMQNGICTLFKLTLKSESLDVIRTAFRALEKFNKEDFQLKSMPEMCLQDLKIPLKYLPNDAEAKIEEVLPYVPGVCWTKLMDVYTEEKLEAGYLNLLSKLVTDEIQSIPHWIYRKSASEHTKQNEPSNYNSLKEDSILAAIIRYMLKIREIDHTHKVRLKMLLRILGSSFDKPLPPLNWIVVQSVVEQYDLKSDFIPVVFSQVAHSFSARTITHDILSQPDFDTEIVTLIMSHLPSISNGLPAKFVEDVVDKILNTPQENWELLLKNMHNSLKCDKLSSGLRRIIAGNLLALVLTLPDDTNILQEFTHCYCELMDVIPWSLDHSPDYVRKSFRILCMAFNSSGSKIAFSYLQKAFHMSIYLPTLDNQLLSDLRIGMSKHKDGEGAVNFMQHFLSHIQLASVKPLDPDQNFRNLLDLFCLLVTVYSETDVFYTQRQPFSIQSAWNLFTLSLNEMFKKPIWSSSKKYILDWMLSIMQNKYADPDIREIFFRSFPSVDNVHREDLFRMMALF